MKTPLSLLAAVLITASSFPLPASAYDSGTYNSFYYNETFNDAFNSSSYYDNNYNNTYGNYYDNNSNNTYNGYYNNYPSNTYNGYYNNSYTRTYPRAYSRQTVEQTLDRRSERANLRLLQPRRSTITRSYTTQRSYTPQRSNDPIGFSPLYLNSDIAMLLPSGWIGIMIKRENSVLFKIATDTVVEARCPVRNIGHNLVNTTEERSSQQHGGYFYSQSFIVGTPKNLIPGVTFTGDRTAVITIKRFGKDSSAQTSCEIWGPVNESVPMVVWEAIWNLLDVPEAMGL